MKKIIFFIILVLFLIGCSSKETPQTSKQTTGDVVLDTKETETKTTCQDSDNGIVTEKAGKVSGIDENNKEYTLYDRCAGHTDIIIEYYCSGGKPTNQNVRCTTEKGCKAGACR